MGWSSQSVNVLQITNGVFKIQYACEIYCKNNFGICGIELQWNWDSNNEMSKLKWLIVKTMGLVWLQSWAVPKFCNQVNSTHRDKFYSCSQIYHLKPPHPPQYKSYFAPLGIYNNNEFSFRMNNNHCKKDISIYLFDPCYLYTMETCLQNPSNSLRSFQIRI